MVKPPLLMTSEPGSFARATIEKRKPEIIAAVINDNDYAPETVHNLIAFQNEIITGLVAPPQSDIPLFDDWLAEWEKWSGRNWLQIPWYFAEAYFYTRLLSIIGYFEGQCGDPFLKKKKTLRQQCAPLISASLTGLPLESDEAALNAYISNSLWGNRLDLSNQAVADRHRAENYYYDDDLLVDDRSDAYRIITGLNNGEVTIICDNSGPELIADLALANWLLRFFASHVVLELKAQPFFVSDAMPADALSTVAFLEKHKSADVSKMGEMLRKAINSGSLILRSHPFWTGPGFYSDLPVDLYQRLTTAGLLIAKGDVNYRRFLEDRHWPFHTPVQKVINYLPKPVLLLRTLKGELAIGLDQKTITNLHSRESDWLISGRYGVAQLAPGTG